MLNELVKRHAADVVPSDLLRGLVGLKALEPNAGLQRLAALARQLDEEVRSCLLDSDIPTIHRLLAESETGRALVRGVEEFLDHYGFLSSNGTDFSATPWIENAALIWSSIGRAAENPPIAISEDVRLVRKRARAHVRGQLGFFRRRFFDRLLASTIAYIDLRERISLAMSKDSYQMRRILLALGEQLLRRGAIDNYDDIFYLTREELHALTNGALTSAAAKVLITSRKAEMEADAQVEPPSTLCGDTVLTVRASVTSDQDFLSGIGGSSGWACGNARIILDPTKAPKRLNNDDILVVPFSDVGWTPLFSGICGIVAETGGQLSHTSIVAREYGIPAVVSVKQATRIIRDGQAVAVDGTRGRVYLRDPAELGQER
jgi:pyruvate,water dikinase